MIHVITVRSPACRGRILGVDVPHLPRGYLALRADDVPGENVLSILGSEIPILAADRVSYAGEPILLLAGPDLSVLTRLRYAVTVSVEKEEPFLSYEDFSPDQVLHRRSAVLGDPDKAFSSASRVVEGVYRTESQEHWYPEPQGAYAAFDYDKLVLRCATQWPFHVRNCASAVLGVKPQEIIVRPTILGVHMDGRLWYPSILAAHAALAAYLCHKPARILLTREEDFRFTPKKARTLIALRAALDASGAVSALDAKIVVNIGAYGPLAAEILEQTCLHATGSLSIPSLRIDGYAVRTNTMPLGAFSGMGAAPAFFAAENLANLITRNNGEDPMDWRSRNILKKGSILATGESLREKTSFEEIAVRLKAASDFARKHGSYELVRKRRAAVRGQESLRGIGLAFGYQESGAPLFAIAPESYVVNAVLKKDLSLEISTSAIAGDEGIHAIWKASAARILGIPEAKVGFTENTTDNVPNSGPSVLSQNIAVISRLVERCCVGIRSRRFRSPLPISSKAVHRTRNPLVWKDGIVRGYPFESLSYCGAVVEIELNPWTMEPSVLGVWLCVDGGRIVSKPHALRSLRTSAMAALGQCVRERLDLEDGVIPEAGFREYGILSLAEAPPISIDLLSWERRQPVRGIGELPFLCIPAAFAGAASQAADLPADRLPLRWEDLFSGMDEV